MILQANPSLGGYEFLIPNGVEIRIPYPKQSAIDRYEDSCNNYLNKRIL
jgi:phage tail protein X